LLAFEGSHQIWIQNSSELLAKVLVETSTYGPTYKRDQKIVSAINSPRRIWSSCSRHR